MSNVQFNLSGSDDKATFLNCQTYIIQLMESSI